jgi:hypothetical protein
MVPDHRKDVVLTIAEKDYLLGAGALYNSLVASGFGGEFVVFCRTTDDMCQRLLRQLQAAREPRVNFRFVDTPRHLAMQKAAFMSDCFSEWPEAECVTYFDPDIVVSDVRWPYVRSWCEHGVTLAADINWDMPSRHPVRKAWARLLQDAGYVVRNHLQIYFNAGFVSVARKDARFCGLWAQFVHQFGAKDKPLELHGEISDWPRKGRWEIIELPDQDTLNIAVTAWEGNLSTFGPDLMGFAPGICYLPHALGDHKPWKRGFIRMGLAGCPPRPVDKAFWRHAARPVVLFSTFSSLFKRLTLLVGAAIGRFYTRQ